MDKPTKRKGTIPLGSAQTHALIQKHRDSIDIETKKQTDRFFKRLRRLTRNRYGAFSEPKSNSANIQSLLEKDPFVFLPLDIRGLGQTSDLQSNMNDYTQSQLYQWPWCPIYANITAGNFSGHPTEPEEIHEGPEWWPPASYAFAQPALGRLELACAISRDLPGRSEAAGFGYSTTSAYLASAQPLFLGTSREVRIRAAPRVSGLFAFGGQDVAGYGVSLQLAAQGAVSGNAKSSSVSIAGKAGTLVGPNLLPTLLPFREERQNQAYPLSVTLGIDSPDLLIISLAITATTFAKAGGLGYALVDIEGLTAPPGKSSYFSPGALSLSSFVIDHPDCPVPTGWYI